MGIEHLQEYIEKECSKACQPVDLLKISRDHTQQQYHKRNAPGPRGRNLGPSRLHLVVDAESCLDRLYGGYYSDWACGGQWNRMVHFLNNMLQACHAANMELVVYFNGALEGDRLQQWYGEQIEVKKKVAQVLKHINNKGTPPPKVWWIPPVCLKSALRLALRQFGIPVACSMDDHHQEVIAYCRENYFHGLIGQNSVYAIFDPPRYFASEHLKLTYHNSLETTEYVIDEFARVIDLHPKRLPVVASLLGNHILSEDDLKGLYLKICPTPSQGQKNPPVEVIKAVIAHVRSLKTVDDLDALGQEIFKEDPKCKEKAHRFRQSVQYYINGTNDGFLKYKTRPRHGHHKKEPGSYPGPTEEPKETKQKEKEKETEKEKEKEKENQKEKEKEKENEEEPDNSEDCIKADKVYTEAESGYSTTSDAPDIVIEPPTPTATTANDIEQKLSEMSVQDKEEKKEEKEKPKIKPLMSLNTEINPDSIKSNTVGRKPMKLPRIPPEIMRIVCERHCKGLMMPWIYQVLSQGELKIDVSLEDDMANELPNAVELYRYTRQKVYAILFDLGPKRAIAKQNPSQSDIMTDVIVREWVIPRGVGGPKGEEVPAISLEWKVPSIRRLWLGQAIEDKNRRLRALLTCMMSDISLMLNTNHVPQHVLILCCVLRYMLMFKEKRVLRRHELEAFLSTAVSPMLMDTEANQDMKLPLITTRGVQLAALFMRGVEAAIFANDACGAPLPWTMTCPWNFFDGKLFHYKLLKANNNCSLLELCDGHMDQVMKVEQMRKAILEGIKMDVFAKQPFQVLPGAPQFPGSVYPGMMRPAGMPGGPQGMRGFQHPMGARGGMGRGRGLLGHSPVDSRGGQLQIAGVVVGNWGANTHGGGGGGGGGHRGGRQSNIGPPQVTSVGPRSGRGNAKYSVVSTRAGRGGGVRGGGRGYAPSSRSIPTQRVQVHNVPVTAQKFYNNSVRGGGMRGGGRGNSMSRGGAPNFRRGMRGDDHNRGSHNGIGRGRGCTVENEGGAVVSINQFISQKDNNGHIHDGSHYGGGAAPPAHIQQNNQYGSPGAPSGALTGAPVMHSHMASQMSTAGGMGMQQHPPASVSMTMGMQGMHGVMAQHQGMAQTNMAGMHQATMAGMHHQSNMHSHFGQGDAPGHAPFVRGASDDDFGQFEDLSASSMMQPSHMNGEMNHPYVSEGVTHIVQHNGRVTVNLGTTLTD